MYATMKQKMDWIPAVRRKRAQNAGGVSTLTGAPVPNRDDEHLGARIHEVPNTNDTQGPPTSCDSPSSVASGRNRENSVPLRVPHLDQRSCLAIDWPCDVPKRTIQAALRTC